VMRSPRPPRSFARRRWPTGHLRAETGGDGILWPMRDPVDRAVRTIARRNSYALIWLQFGLAHVVMLGGLGLLALYQHMSSGAFWLLLAISQALVSLDNLLSIK